MIFRSPDVENSEELLKTRKNPHFYFKKEFSPSQRREAPCEGTNSVRHFTPGRREALAKSEVHQLSRARTYTWVVISLTSKFGGLS